MRLVRQAGRSFCAGLELPAEGVHTVVVSAGKDAALTVAGVFQVRVGPEAPAPSEPSTVEGARNEVLLRINALRKGQGLTGVKRDGLLERVAQAYADRMAREGFYGPQAPDGTTLRERLLEGVSVSSSVAENLGWGSGPLAAHFGIELLSESRRNLLSPKLRLVGIGLAWKPSKEGGREALVVEVMASDSPVHLQAGSPGEEAYQTVARLRALPREAKRPALVRSPVLVSLAAEVARSNHAPGEVVHTALYERAMKVLPEARTVAIELYEVADVLNLPRAAAQADAPPRTWARQWCAPRLARGRPRNGWPSSTPPDQHHIADCRSTWFHQWIQLDCSRRGTARPTV
ncbi:CAP domain-containing protein [Hyalangium gracile]|uniref:CAP domain-containing protein n=1 Tax=Hyalangium gracile TaxID=394092 RepID=UPI001CCBBDC9|nr:CAP domain-containing protein [Hyalangium gracile]